MKSIQSFEPYFFFFNDTATTEIYTLSLHDALPIFAGAGDAVGRGEHLGRRLDLQGQRSEEHTSELQSRRDLVCRLLLEKKKNIHRDPDVHCLLYPVCPTDLQCDYLTFK